MIICTQLTRLIVIITSSLILIVDATYAQSYAVSSLSPTNRKTQVFIPIAVEVKEVKSPFIIEQPKFERGVPVVVMEVLPLDMPKPISPLKEVAYGAATTDISNYDNTILIRVVPTVEFNTKNVKAVGFDLGSALIDEKAQHLINSNVLMFNQQDVRALFLTGVASSNEVPHGVASNELAILRVSNVEKALRHAGFIGTILMDAPKLEQSGMRPSVLLTTLD